MIWFAIAVSPVAIIFGVKGAMFITDAFYGGDKWDDRLMSLALGWALICAGALLIWLPWATI